MPKISQAKRDERRGLILEAALRCFSRDGFHHTTTADIVRESGISQGALYLYFATKDDIIAALADDRHQSEVILNALAQQEQDPISGLLVLIELYGKGLGHPESLDMRRVGVQGWGEALRNPAVRKTVVEGMSSVCSAIMTLVERAQRTGQIRSEISPEAVARLMIATFQGLVLLVAWDEPFDHAGCGQLLRAFIRDTLLTDAGRATFKADGLSSQTVSKGKEILL